MKLTKTIREAFVRAAMQDVPQIDYEDLIRKATVAEYERIMPPEVAAAYKKHPAWINTDYRRLGNAGRSARVPVPDRSYDATVHDQKAIKAINDMEAKRKEQDASRTELEAKLMGAANSCTTRKALAELLPEFEKYLPADQAAACKTLPAVANIVADFTKAGWPAQAIPSIKRAA